MGYVDIQDVNRERQAHVRKEQDAKSAERHAETVERDVRMRGMFKDPCRAWLDEQVRVDLEAAAGLPSPPELAAAQQEAWTALAPVINEIPGQPLSLNAVKELVIGIQRGHVSEARKGQLIDLLLSTRSKVYQTTATETAKLAAMNEDLAKARPKLNELLKATGAGNSIPLARELLAEAAEQAQKRRPFASLVRPK